MAELTEDQEKAQRDKLAERLSIETPNGARGGQAIAYQAEVVKEFGEGDSGVEKFNPEIETGAGAKAPAADAVTSADKAPARKKAAKAEGSAE